MTDAHVVHSERGTITLTPATLAHVVLRAAETVDGARVRRPRRGLEIDVEDGRVRAELELAARFGAVLPELAADVQARVADALRDLCGLEVEAVEVAVEELDA